MNGRVVGDSPGQFSYYSPRGCGAIDYIVASEDLFHQFIYINVLSPAELSDHCIVKKSFII